LRWSPWPARQGRSLQHQPRKGRHQHGRPLRYRLFDIDRLISRTLVYGLLTAVLAGVYVTGVFISGRLLHPTTGDSALAVAASTLAVAGLFQPLRRRIQRLVDRRFNRSRYDVARTVEAFSGRLREEIDLDSLKLNCSR
jgi:hypothetical protein